MLHSRACIVGLVGALMAACSTIPVEPVADTRSEVLVYDNVVYSMVGDQELELDIFVPTSGTGPYPAILYFFGGGFTQGSKEFYTIQSKMAARRGYVAIAVEYRLLTALDKGAYRDVRNRFPAQVEDCRYAVRWVRAHARELRIDPDRIGAFGYSAGAYLAMMLAVTDNHDWPDDERGLDRYSSRVQGAFNLKGPVDMARDYHDHEARTLAALMGGTPAEVPEVYARASLLSYVDGGDSPIYSLYGERDADVRPYHGQLLDESYRRAGVPHTLVVEPGAGHTDGSIGVDESFAFFDELFDQ